MITGINKTKLAISDYVLNPRIEDKRGDRVVATNLRTGALFLYRVTWNSDNGKIFQTQLGSTFYEGNLQDSTDHVKVIYRGDSRGQNLFLKELEGEILDEEGYKASSKNRDIIMWALFTAFAALVFSFIYCFLKHVANL